MSEFNLHKYLINKPANEALNEIGRGHMPTIVSTKKSGKPKMATGLLDHHSCGLIRLITFFFHQLGAKNPINLLFQISPPVIVTIDTTRQFNKAFIELTARLF